MNKRLTIHICPNCGSDQITLVCRTLEREFDGQFYTVPDIQFYECPVCEQRIFDRDAVRKMQIYSPAYGQQRTAKQKPSEAVAV